MRVFGSYGYVPLEPPSVERAGASRSVDERRLIRFLDQGNLLALRPDVTTAVARVVAQRYREARDAIRLSYFTTVFRQDRSMRGSEREYDQAGVELIGPGGAAADAEVLAVLCEALSALGLRHATPGADGPGTFTIEVGHIGAVRELFGGLSPDVMDVVLAHLREADHVEAFRVAAAAFGRERAERARRGLAARGRLIEGVGVAAATELREAIHLARELFAGEPLWGVPNLSVVPSLPYYTGIVFEVVSPRAGAPIAVGGRYDDLLSRYGTDRPATGFAIAIPLLHQALVASGWRQAASGPLVCVDEDGDPRVRLRAAAALRRAGLAVVLGAVADSAGREVVRVRAVGDGILTFRDRTLSAEDLAAVMRARGTGGPR